MNLIIFDVFWILSVFGGFAARRDRFKSNTFRSILALVFSGWFVIDISLIPTEYDGHQVLERHRATAKRFKVLRFWILA